MSGASKDVSGAAKIADEAEPAQNKNKKAKTNANNEVHDLTRTNPHFMPRIF
jgi:hypothetical protein